jgi:steroid delta-isomerase
MLEPINSVNDRRHIDGALRAYIDSWATGDVPARVALFADDVVVEDPATITRARGKEQLIAHLAAGIPANWDLTFTYVRAAINGDEAILTYLVGLTIPDALPGELLVNAHVSFGADGLITSFRAFFDTESISE